MVSSTISLIWLLGLAILGIIFIIMIIFTGFRENIMLFSLLVVFIICLMLSLYLGDSVETETFYANEYDIEQMSKDYNAIVKYINYDCADNKGDFLEHNMLFEKDEWIYYKYSPQNSDYDKYKLINTKNTTEKGE